MLKIFQKYEKLITNYKKNYKISVLNKKRNTEKNLFLFHDNLPNLS